MMREFSKVSHKFFLNQDLRQFANENGGNITRELAAYLIFGPEATMLGIYRIPYQTIAYDLQISVDLVPNLMQNLIDIDFIRYDEKYQFVWVTKMANWQIGEQLSPTNKLTKKVKSEFKTLPKLSFTEQFLNIYGQSLCILEKLSTIEIPNRNTHSEKVIHSGMGMHQEREREEDTETDTEKEKERLAVVNSGTFFSVFDHWRTLLGYPRHELTKSRKKSIEAAFAMGFSEQDLKDAITGCSKTPYNMGENDKNQKLDSLQFILESEASINKFINNNRKSNLKQLASVIGESLKKINTTPKG